MAFANRSLVFRSSAPFVATGVLLAGVAWSRGAVAGGPIGPNGSTITTSDYVLDLHQGPVFAGARVTGLDVRTGAGGPPYDARFFLVKGLPLMMALPQQRGPDRRGVPARLGCAGFHALGA